MQCRAEFHDECVDINPIGGAMWRRRMASLKGARQLVTIERHAEPRLLVMFLAQA